MKLLEIANIMHCVRRCHRRAKTVENWQMAIDCGVVVGYKEAKALCLELGLYPFGKKLCTEKVTMKGYQLHKIGLCKTKAEYEKLIDRVGLVHEKKKLYISHYKVTYKCGQELHVAKELID